MSFTDYKEVAKEYGVGGGDWMKLQTGENKIRFVSEFRPYGSHFDRANKKSVVCIGREECEPCQAGDKPRVQFLGWVLNRSDGEVKLLQVGYSVYKAMGELGKSEDYAFDTLPPYDVTIKKEGEGLETEYSVIPARQNTELTDEEKSLVLEIVKDPNEVIDSMKSKVIPTITEE